MKKFWVGSCIFMLVVSTVFSATVYSSPRLRIEIGNRVSRDGPEIKAALLRFVTHIPVAQILTKIARADLGRRAPIFEVRETPVVLPVTPVVNRTLLPAQGETWTFDFERMVKLKSDQSPGIQTHVRGAYSISHREGASADYFIKVELSEGGIEGSSSQKFPLFQVSLGGDGKIERVFVLGQLKEAAIQDHWENLGKDLISNYFILESRTRLGASESESKWMGDSLYEKTVFSYSAHPELKIDGSNHLAYFDESGLALVEGSERLVLGDKSRLNQSQSYRMERVMITSGELKFEKSGPARSLHWGSEKRLFSGSSYRSASFSAPVTRDLHEVGGKWKKKKSLLRSRALAASEDL